MPGHWHSKRKAPGQGHLEPNIARGMTSFTPRIDRQAKWHKRFDSLMNDDKLKKARAKVTLPKFKFMDEK